MNASEQAKGLELTAKIATVVNLFKQQFPDARADLKPWRNDPDTLNLVDPHSIDIGFHFPGWSPKIQSRSILVQIRLHDDPEIETRNLIGLDMVGINHQGTAWQMSTIGQWQLTGQSLPVAAVGEKLKQFCEQVFELFRSGS
ncbi:MAG: hypothetical protein N5P05_002132 [Chroococcopsis gigantea SAG 12.99]|jgi:hypothetical protein|nr:hypothetical protein [Chlorogloea purpurea SAG 13.99]MDV3000526.1 hypothetical protein [Chroococcopsis gigantea SAG 12.99]